jgi:hypothetical protein
MDTLHERLQHRVVASAHLDRLSARIATEGERVHMVAMNGAGAESADEISDGAALAR